MFRAIPTNNKICFDKDLKRSWKIHAEKVKYIKSTLKQTKPTQYPFLDQRPKKLALEELRYMEIQKQNNCLLDRIKSINQKGNKKNISKSIQNFDRKKTLNEPFRKRELVKIVQENQQLMKRIQSKKSMYNVKKWEKQRKCVQKNITLLSEFKYKDYPSTQTKVNLWMTEQDFSKNSRVENLSFQKSRIKPSLTYSGTRKIGQSYYLVQTYANKKIFNIEMENLENSHDKYRMEIPQEQAYNLIKNNYNGTLEELIESLQINYNEECCCLRYNRRE